MKLAQTYQDENIKLKSELYALRYGSEAKPQLESTLMSQLDRMMSILQFMSTDRQGLPRDDKSNLETNLETNLKLNEQLLLKNEEIKLLKRENELLSTQKELQIVKKDKKRTSSTHNVYNNNKYPETEEEKLKMMDNLSQALTKHLNNVSSVQDAENIECDEAWEDNDAQWSDDNNDLLE